MGALRDAARNNSNFLLIEKGTSVVAEYVGFQLVPNMRDPSKQSALYEFKEMGKQKFWTNGSSAIMFFFDDCPRGRLVKITRNAFFNKQGVEDPLKSSYEVELYYEAPAPAPPVQTPKTQVTQFQAKNPDNVQEPGDIAWKD